MELEEAADLAGSPGPCCMRDLLLLSGGTKSADAGNCGLVIISNRMLGWELARPAAVQGIRYCT